MKHSIVVTLIIPALVLCLCALPAAAVLQEVTVKGTVSAISQEKNTLTIENPLRYGCTYPDSGAPVCSYTAMDMVSLSGTVPSSSAFSVLQTGDTVVATSIGGAGNSWIAVAKLFGPLPSEEYVTDIFGDPGTIPTPLVGDYALDLTTTPDCTTCFGTTCNAALSTVDILSSGTRVMVKTLEPRQALMYNGRNDGSSISVTFVSGEASSSHCLSGSGMTGPQPISVYVVNVVPPISFTQQFLTTPTIPPAPATTIPTTKSDSLPLAVIGALGAVVFLLAYCRR